MFEPIEIIENQFIFSHNRLFNVENLQRPNRISGSFRINYFFKIASTGFFPVNLVSSLFKPETTSGSLFTHSLDLIPAQGYQPARKYSVMAIQWMAWVHHQSGDRILHALNGGEQCIDGNFVDGYDPAKKTIYEFMGCMWHGCHKCYLPDTVNPVNGTSMEDLSEGPVRKIDRFKKLGFRIEVPWQCEFHQQVAANPEMKAFVQNLKFDTPLEPRHAFFGGRTNAVCLYEEVSEDEKIHYVDFTSLYHWTNNYRAIPIDHPEILTSEALIDSSPGEFFGLIKCDILPPTFLFHPVLPYCANEKLMFPLCKTCAENIQQSPCEHNEKERMLSGTWCSI